VAQPTKDFNSTIIQFWTLLVRNRWWIISTACIVSLTTIQYSFLIPDRYRSEATISIAKPTVPQAYVVLNNTANSMDALDTIKREVLSRSRLQQIIDEFSLYPEKKALGTAAVTEIMRGDIELQAMSKDPERRPMNAFLIAFTGPNPTIARQVTNRITALFIEENMKKQQQNDTGTTSFLQSQVAIAQAELDRQESLIRDYKLKNIGNLPEQSAGNIEILNGLQIQLQGAESNLARARQERTYLQSMLSHYASGEAEQSTSLPGSEVRLQQEVARLRSQRDELLARYSPRYPDVVSLDQQIADDDAQISRLVAGHESSAVTGKSAEAKEVALLPDSSSLQLRSQLEANTVEIADALKQTKWLGTQIATYQNRLTLAPVREQQFDDVQRNYETAKANLASLLNKETQSELATEMGVQQGFQQYRVIDTASLPIRPVSPNRKKIALGGLAAGIVCGLGMALLVDAKDRSFHTEGEVRRFLPVPIVVGIPPLRTPAERRMLAHRSAFEWALGCLLILTIAAAQFMVFRKG
jgi:polysaccharide chain length determinant protein (PEP-CTERM system associated)